MTTTEFKKAHPHLAHLEGDELWDAMTSETIKEMGLKEPQPVTDWKGNIIKEGDEVCIIKIVDRPMFSNFGILVPVGGGVRWDSAEAPEPKECWIPGEYLKIREGLTYVVNVHDQIVNSHVSLLTLFLDKDHILAIKGVSDKNPNE